MISLRYGSGGIPPQVSDAAGSQSIGSALNDPSSDTDERGGVTFGTVGGAVAGPLTTVVFANAYQKKPFVILQPANQATANDAALARVFPTLIGADGGWSGFVITAPAAPLAGQPAGTFFCEWAVIG